MTTIVTRESLTTETRHASPSFGKRDGSQVLVDYSEPLPVVDVNHYRLHEGRGFLSYYVITSLADTASMSLALAANAGYYPHMTIGAFCGGNSTLYFYESSVASGGTAFVPVQRNRNFTTTSNVAITNGPTVTSVGTLLYQEFLPAGVKKKSGGGGGEALEFALKPLTNYLVRITNTSGAAQTAEITLEWYE